MSDKAKLKPPSDAFNDVVQDSSTIRATCELCGREYFAAPGNGDYDEGEYEGLAAEAEKDPGKYIETPDFVPIGHINGKQVVIGCTCNELYRYEAFIWNHKEMIMEYLTAVIKGRVNDAAQLFKMARAARKAVASSDIKRPNRVFDFS